MKNLIKRKGSLIDEEELTTSQELSEENFAYDIPTEDTQDSKPIVISQVHNVLNKITQDLPDSLTGKHVTEVELPKENGEQNNIHKNILLSTNFEVKVGNQKLKGSYPIHINKNSNLRLILEVSKKYGEFMLILNPINRNGLAMASSNIWVSILQHRIQMS